MTGASHSDVEKLITRSYQLFEIGNFDEAQLLLDEAYRIDFENLEIRSALRACGFWQQRLKNLKGIAGDGARADYLRRHWAVFSDSYRKGFEHPFADGMSRLGQWANGLALEGYTRQAALTPDPVAMMKAGRCLKALGRFEECISALEQAMRLTGGPDAALMAELADTYALIGESRPAKVMMREALFVAASEVDWNEIQAPLFRRLIDRLTEVVGITEAAFPEWLPVYGAIWGVLDVKRELTPVEYGKLKQTIYALKSELADGDADGCLTPRLINLYLRLIDHYQAAGSDRSLIDDALINIKLLSPAIHRAYLE